MARAAAQGMYREYYFELKKRLQFNRESKKRGVCYYIADCCSKGLKLCSSITRSTLLMFNRPLSIMGGKSAGLAWMEAHEITRKQICSYVFI